MNKVVLNAHALEQAEAAAVGDWVNSIPAAEANALGCVVTPAGDGHAIMVRGVNIMILNRVIGLGTSAPITRAAVAAVAATLRDHAAPNHAVQPFPDSVTTDAVEWLAEEGLTYSDSWIRLYRDASPVIAPASRLRVRRISTGDVDRFGAILGEAFPWFAEIAPLNRWVIGRKGWFHYIAYDGDKPVAVAALYVQNGYGWLGFAGTRRDYRRLGAQSALIARRVEEGIRAGCHTFVVETADDTPEHPNPSTHNLLRAGFRVAYRRPNYRHT